MGQICGVWDTKKIEKKSQFLELRRFFLTKFLGVLRDFPGESCAKARENKTTELRLRGEGQIIKSSY